MKSNDLKTLPPHEADTVFVLLVRMTEAALSNANLEFECLFNQGSAASAFVVT